MASTTKSVYYYALGRRKSSTARVRIMSGKGDIKVNGKTANDYFCGSKFLLNKLNTPFLTVDMLGKFDVFAKVNGGGHNSQIEAISLGVAKALIVYNPDFKSTLKRADLLGRDPREKERKKFGFKSARKQRQFTKR
jgi:small subunit ribosomal protein S9